METVRFDGATKRYRSGFGRPVEALKGLTFAAHAGECVGLLGHNGAGKSTAMKLLLGFLAPEAGRATILGRVMRDDPAVAREVAYVPENVRFQPHLTPHELIRYYASLAGVPADRAAAVRLVGAAGLGGELLDRRIGHLSKGMNQRLAIALLGLKSAAVIVLDEPSTGLDPDGRRILKELVRARVAAGATVLLSSHNLSEIEPLVDRAAILRNGELLDLTDRAALRARERQVVTFRGAAAPATFAGLDAELASDETATTLVCGTPAAAADAVSRGLAAGLALVAFGPRPYTLEEYYLEKTGGRK